MTTIPPASTTPASTPTPALPVLPRGEAPFLVWPVSRREFYRTICFALLPALAWGMVLFGNRVLALLLLATAATSFTYLLLKRILKWRRAQPLMFWHCLLGALVLVALAHPTWPVWVITALALLLPVAFTAIGGPGRERIHVAVAAVLMVQYIILPHLPALHPGLYTGKPDAILARNRLFMGDIRDRLIVNGREVDLATLHRWPNSRDLAGNDAVAYEPPAVTAAQTLDQVSSVLSGTRETARRNAKGAGGGGSGGEMSAVEVARIRTILDDTFATRLPAMDMFYYGVAPNRIGAASLIAMTFAGLFLSYRYILRPRSVLFFLVTFIVATALLTFTPGTVQRVGLPVLWDLLRQFPGQIVTLFNFLLWNSDAPFAAVIILALPGTEPLTARGRRFFLILAALAAAALHRLDPTTPAATLVLCLLMPLAPLFDRALAQRSWLGR